MDKQNYTLSIVIPCYNEQGSILEIVEKVRRSPVKNKEIIIVDDMSTDGTREILENEVKPLVSMIIYHDINQGKGKALQTGFQHATGDIVIVQDADLEYDPDEYPLVVEPILNNECVVCYGSRFINNNEKKGYKANRLANVFLTKLSNRFTHQHLTDMETCYKAFRREVIQSVNLEESRFGFEPEITAKLAAMNIQIKEVPVSYCPRTTKEGKKIGIRDGIRAIYCI